jgi:hypothetical protein
MTSRRWDKQPETEKDARFFDLRESGYRGWIDQDGNAVSAAEKARLDDEAQKGGR